MSEKQNNFEIFLKELSDLSEKHGFFIHGCGCCGSPWVEDANEKDVAEDLHYLEGIGYVCR